MFNMYVLRLCIFLSLLNFLIHIVEAECNLPPDSGNGDTDTAMWYYDPNKVNCHVFAYSGRGGNSNKFTNKRECLEACTKKVKISGLLNNEIKKARSAAGLVEDAGGNVHLDAKGNLKLEFVQRSQNTKDNEIYKLPYGLEEVCRQMPEKGNCEENIPLWYYDRKLISCISFTWSGCGGNQNRFVSKKLCMATCTRTIRVSKKMAESLTGGSSGEKRGRSFWSSIGRMVGQVTKGLEVVQETTDFIEDDDNDNDNNLENEYVYYR